MEGEIVRVLDKESRTFKDVDYAPKDPVVVVIESGKHSYELKVRR